ncbi:MAG TPA: glycine zipper 2TM domain-containing protein [Gammaproteobacteria bacterium]
MLRRWMTIGAMAGALAAADAAAGPRGMTDYVYARVVDVEPIVRYVTVRRPREECWDEVVQVPVRDRPFVVAGPAIAGGLIGGAIGRQFGHGDGRDALTLLGAIAGSAVASERAARNRAYEGHVRETTVERCEVVTERHTEERIDGYRVTYQYRGRRDTIVMPHPPGERVRLRVTAVPVGYR